MGQKRGGEEIGLVDRGRGGGLGYEGGGFGGTCGREVMEGGGSGWCEGGGLGGTRGREVMEGRGGGEFFWVGLVGDLLLPCE